MYLLEEEGQGATEWALALAMGVIAVIGVLMLLGPGFGDALGHVGGNLLSLSP